MYKLILSVILLIAFCFIFYLGINPQKNSPISSPSSYEENFSDWIAFTPHSNLFKVSLPISPQFFEDAIELPFSPEKGEYEIYASTKVNGTLFMINLITYPKKAEAANPNETLRALVEQVSYTRPGNRIVNLKESEFEGYPALDFSIENNDFKIEGKAFLVNKRVFILNYAAKKKDFDIQEYDHFLHSFSLLKAVNEVKTDSKHEPRSKGVQ